MVVRKIAKSEVIDLNVGHMRRISEIFQELVVGGWKGVDGSHFAGRQHHFGSGRGPVRSRMLSCLG